MYTNLKSALAGLALAGAVCALPVAANAGVVVLPGAVWSGFVKTPIAGPPNSYITQQVTGPGTIQLGLGNSFAGETSLPIPPPTFLPTLSVRAGGFDLAQFSGGTATVALTYYLEIVGPGSSLAPLVTAGSGSVSSFNGGVGYAELFVTTPGIGGSTAVVSTNGKTSVPDTDGFKALLPDNSLFSINYTMMFPVNTPIQVLMIASAQSDFELGPSAASAFIDPMFSIDPSFANAGLYSIVTSDGIGNGGGTSAPGVPEPSAWALMLVGFGALGATLRGRRRNAALRA
jgi:hypothetical protein